MQERYVAEEAWERPQTSLRHSTAIKRFVDTLEEAGRIEYGPAGVLTALGMGDGERLIIQDIEHNVLRRILHLTPAEEQWIPYVEHPLYLDGHLAPYPIALRGSGSKRMVRVKEQSQLVAFADAWGDSLITQGWLEHSTKLDIALVEEVISPAFALTVREQERFARWVGTSGCEALDGCWVEPTECCEHGSPSWYRELGLI